MKTLAEEICETIDKGVILLEAIKTFENHFPDLMFAHLAAFRQELRQWDDKEKETVIRQLVASGVISYNNGILRRK